MGNANETIAKASGTVASIGGLDRAAVEFMGSSFITNLAGSGSVAAGVATAVGASSVICVVTAFGVDWSDHL